MSDYSPRNPPTDAIVPPHWAELAPLLDVVMDAPPDQRQRVLDEVSGGDAARRAALSRLLDDCEQAMPMLDRLAAA